MKWCHPNLVTPEVGLFLFVLTGTFSSDHQALKSRWEGAKSQWGDAKSRWGTLTLDGGTRPPNNLSTDLSPIIYKVNFCVEFNVSQVNVFFALL